MGTRITGSVVRVELWLQHNDDRVLVLAPEISWKPVGAVFRVGDGLEVLAVRYNYQERVVVGSLKALHPEENPYRKLARLEPGTVLVGRVASVFSDQICVELPDGVWGNIPRYRVIEELAPGDRVEVKILALEVDQGLLTLDFVRKLEDEP